MELIQSEDILPELEELPKIEDPSFQMELIRACEMGRYFRYRRKVVFLSNQDMEMDSYIGSIKSRFKEEWPTRWEEIKTSIPEGPFPFTAAQNHREGMLVKDLADVLLLTRADWLRLGLGEDHVDKLRLEIGKSKCQPFAKVLYSLGIRHIGKGTAKMLADRFNSLDRLGRATWREVILTPGIGATVGTSILGFFHSEDSWRNIEKLRLAGVDYAFGYTGTKEVPETAPTPSPVAGKTFMFTGRLECYTRHQAQEKIEELGGFSGSSVSSNTDYLVVGEAPGSKLGRAVALGVKRLSEEDFHKLLQGGTI